MGPTTGRRARNDMRRLLNCGPFLLIMELQQKYEASKKLSHFVNLTKIPKKKRHLRFYKSAYVYEPQIAESSCDQWSGDHENESRFCAHQPWYSDPQ